MRANDKAGEPFPAAALALLDALYGYARVLTSDPTAHLRNCPVCRETFEQEHHWIQIVRAARLLYCAPANLRARIQRMLEQGRPHAGKSRRILTVGRYLGLGLATLVLGSLLAVRMITTQISSEFAQKVISWSDRGLTYALVSRLAERGQQSCLVCHQGSQDRDFVEQLRP